MSSFGGNGLGLKLVGVFFAIVPLFVQKDLVWHRFVAQIRAKWHLLARRILRISARATE